MIHLDTYLENFESKLEEIQNSIVYVKSYKKPKIRITRLSEERKFVPIELDIEINENLVIKDRFDWNLNDENVCVEDFVNELCDTLNLPEINRSRLKSSLIYQLIDYIERNTYYPRQKNKDQKNDDEEYELDSDIKEGIANSSKVAGQNDSKMMGQNREQQEEEQKKTARQRKLDEMRRSSNSQIQPIGKASYIRDKRSCKNCNYVNSAPSFECKKCKVAFYLLQNTLFIKNILIKREMLDLSQWRVAQAVQYYEICVSYFPLLGDYIKDYTNLLSAQDFSSIYSLKIALKKLFPTMKELSEDNIRVVNNKLEDLFASFLAGIVVYRQEEFLPQKRRGRKPKSWYEDQEKRKKEKRERKERGEIVSSDVEDEDDSEDEDDLQAINKKISEIEQLTIQGGANSTVNAGATKDQDNKESGNKDDDTNAGQADDQEQDSNTDGSVVIRRGRGRPPKKSTYQGKKRGRKPKTMSESLIRASSKNIGDQEKDNDDEDGDQLEDGENKNDMVSEGEGNEDGFDSKVKSSVVKNDEENIGEEKMEEESLQQNKVSDIKFVKNDSKKYKDKYLDEDDEEQFDVDDDDDEDYGSSIRKSTTGKRGRPPKNKFQPPGRRGRKPLPKKEEKQPEADDIKSENQESKEDKQNENENENNKNEMIEEYNQKEEKEQTSNPLSSKIQSSQIAEKTSKQKYNEDENSQQVIDYSEDEEFSIKKQPVVKTSRRGRPRKEEQRVVHKDEEEAQDEEEDNSSLPNRKQKIIKKQFRTRFSRHQHNANNSAEEDNQENEEEDNQSIKVQTRKHQNVKRKEQELSEDDKVTEEEEDDDYDMKKKKKEKSQIKKKEESEDEVVEIKKGRQEKKKEIDEMELENADENEPADNEDQSDSDKEDNEDNQDEGDQDEEEGDEDEEDADQEEEDEEEESLQSGVRTRRSQRTHSNDSNSQKKKGVTKQKKITKEKSTSSSYKGEQEAPRKKGRPPKKQIIQRGRKK